MYVIEMFRSIFSFGPTSRPFQSIERIVLIKNTFPLLDDNDDNYRFCDIKANVLIESNGIGIIGEIQFLALWIINRICY